MVCTRRCWRRLAHDSYSESTVRTATVWLLRLERQARLVRELEIVIGRDCPIGCPDHLSHHKRPIDVAYLFSAIWRQNLTGLKITFAQPTQPCRVRGVPDIGAKDVLDSTQPSRDTCRIPELCNVLRALSRDDLDIKKYWQTLQHVKIKRDGSGGDIMFWTTSKIGRWFVDAEDDSGFDWRKSKRTDNVRFFEADQGMNLRMLDREVPTLSSLAMGLVDRIVEYTMMKEPEIRISLDTAKDLRILTAPCFVSPVWRTRYEHLLSNTDYIFEVSGGADHTYLTALRRLNSFFRSKFYISAWEREEYNATEPTARPFGEVADFRICICFETGPTSTLHDVRFNVTPLLEATSWFDEEREIHISVRGRSDSNTALEVTSNTLNINYIRADAIRAWPSFHLRDINTESPEIWMDGLGNVVDVKEKQVSVESVSSGS
jgi:hypothetical protein